MSYNFICSSQFSLSQEHLHKLVIADTDIYPLCKVQKMDEQHLSGCNSPIAETEVSNFFTGRLMGEWRKYQELTLDKVK